MTLIAIILCLLFSHGIAIFVGMWMFSAFRNDDDTALAEALEFERFNHREAA